LLRFPGRFLKGLLFSSSSFSCTASLASAREKNFRSRRAAVIHVETNLTDPSAAALSFLSEMSDKKDYRRKKIIGTLCKKAS
jgi:hypothetical protein